MFRAGVVLCLVAASANFEDIRRLLKTVWIPHEVLQNVRPHLLTRSRFFVKSGYIIFETKSKKNDVYYENLDNKEDRLNLVSNI